jgi:hypothetical protein
VADTFVYSYRYPEKPPVVQTLETLTRSCKRCKAEFQTTSRVRERCDPCRVVRRDEVTKKAHERRSKKRRAGR